MHVKYSFLYFILFYISPIKQNIKRIILYYTPLINTILSSSFVLSCLLCPCNVHPFLLTKLYLSSSYLD